MKKLILLAMVLGLLVSGCNVFEENKSLKTKNQQLEQRAKELDQRVKELEQAISKLNQDDLELDFCLARAKQNRETAMKLNDTKQKKGSYFVPITLMEQIRKEYKDECDECYRRYGRR